MKTHHAFVAGLSLLTLLPCGREVPPPAPPEAPAPADGVVAPPAQAAEAAGPSVQVERMEGTASESAKQALNLTGEPLKRCEAGRGLLLSVTILGENGKARIDIKPGSGVDAAVGRCVLEALSTADFPEVLDATPTQAEASTEPRRFAAQLSIRW